MLFKNLVIPMRAQPFHKGHAHLIATMAKYCQRGVVVLCRDSDTDQNPFPHYIRMMWVIRFLKEHNIQNISVPYRRNNISRYEEYIGFFPTHSCDGITVLTTSETNEFYQRIFMTYNHHEDRCGVWRRYLLPQGLELSGNGTIIRHYLKMGIPCSRYLDGSIELTARMIV